jgi:flagellar biosynthesis protein FlhF
MRLRSFTAPTIVQAMKLVREALGPDAIIVSTHAANKSAPARVTAAIEPVVDATEKEGGDRAHETCAHETDFEKSASRAHRIVRDAFDFHGVPAILAQRLGGFAGDALNSGAARGDALLALAASLDRRFRFEPLFDSCGPRRPLILVGPPGAGKTATVAKLAARAVLAGKRPAVITTDTVRAGGVEQLAAFTKILDIDIQVAEDTGALADAVLAGSSAGNKPDVLLIDTAGANPYDDEEIARVKALVNEAGAAAILVLSAGGDPLEAAEAAVAFSDVGAKRLVMTRIDAARRHASLLTAAEAGKLALSNVGTTPHIANGLAPLNPVSLARLLIGDLIEDKSSATPALDRPPLSLKAAS